MFDAKRLIGRKMDEPEIKRDIKHWPFKVIEKGGKPSVQVQYKGSAHDFVRRSLASHNFEYYLLNGFLCIALDSRGDLRHGFDEDEGDR